MPGVTPADARQFAVDVVRRLRSSGHQALWAGGCVRDQLLGLVPKDYDVATSATPEQIRQVFGRRRTLAIGAAFGVISVLGPPGAGQIEVATFRQDATYSDGRHPDHVSFSTAEKDALRRDFTINGLFFDPLRNQVIDYVGGQRDLDQRLLRAIGDPHERIAEDKLRMLRAVRIAATYGLSLEANTLAAVVQHASEITIVSAERIAGEMRRLLQDPNRARGVQLLRESGLLWTLLPESQQVFGDSSGDDAWQESLQILQNLSRPDFSLGLAALLRPLVNAPPAPQAASICRRWRLSNDETKQVERLLLEEPLVRQASRLAWPRAQRILTAKGIDQLLDFAEAVARVVDGHCREIEWCRAKLALPPEQLDPAPLIDGNDLKEHGIPPGPNYRRLLQAVRDAQLEKQIATRQQALSLADRLARQSPDDATQQG